MFPKVTEITPMKLERSKIFLQGVYRYAGKAMNIRLAV